MIMHLSIETGHHKSRWPEIILTVSAGHKMSKSTYKVDYDLLSIENDP